MNYDEYLTQRLDDLVKRKNQSYNINDGEPFVELKWTQATEEANRDYFRGLVLNRIATQADITKAKAEAKRRATIEAELGAMPRDPVDYARLYMAKVRATVTYKGAITIPGASSPTILDLERGARLLANDLDIRMTRDTVNDGVEEYYSRQRDAALDTIKATIEPRATFPWERLVKGCFDCRETSPEFVIAVLKKFLWQVKRKMFGAPVTYHLMPVIIGEQGRGKSYLVQRLLASIDEVVTISDFEAIGDSRNIDLWRSFVIFMDEMGKAGKADMETTKSLITADYIERRPMRTNSTVRVRQSATFIGTSNISLPELIKDETGLRRFTELRFGSPAFGFIDEFDFALAWRSVHHTDADPMAEHMAALASLQADWRNQGPVETWLRDLDQHDWRNLSEKADDTGFLSTQALFDCYLAHRVCVNGGQEREHRSRNSFGQELSRILSQEDHGIVKHRTNRANGWRITRDTLRLVIGGAR